MSKDNGQKDRAGRLEALDAGEARLLLQLLTQSSYALEYAATAEKLRRIADELERVKL